MKKSVLFSAILFAATLSSAMAKDCRLKLIPTYNVSDFADVDTTKTAFEISKTLQDRRHGFDISNDADAPYTIQYTINANASDKRNVQTSYAMQFSVSGSSSQISASGNNDGTARKEKNQSKLYNKTVEALISSLPGCPRR